MSIPTVNSFQVHQLYNRLVLQGGDIDQAVELYLQPYFSSLKYLPSSRCIDLIRIATAVFGVDRIVRRTSRVDNPNGIRTLHLTIEVADLEFWNESKPKNLIEEILSFLTDDNWRVDFIPIDKNYLSPCYQSCLDLPGFKIPRRAALYSGGLDSAAGLANQLIERREPHLLITVGHHLGLRKKVNRQIAQLAGLLRIPAPRQLILVTHLRRGAARRISMQETSQRSRAFLFYTVAGVSATAFGIDTIEVFENGAGAINFPLISAMLNSGLATRGAHPTFLRYMSDLSSLVAESTLEFKLPFFNLTKGEMLVPLRDKGLDRWLQSSLSCIHTSSRIRGVRHCGKCPACIERRQAFIASGIKEDISDYQEDILSDMASVYENDDYFRMYCEESSAWLKKEPRTLRRMANHLRTTHIPGNDDKRIYNLQDRHAGEVDRIFLRYGLNSGPRRDLLRTTSDLQNS